MRLNATIIQIISILIEHLCVFGLRSRCKQQYYRYKFRLIDPFYSAKYSVYKYCLYWLSAGIFDVIDFTIFVFFFILLIVKDALLYSK